MNPIERISEILFGLIVALSFTCAISVAETDRIGVKEMLLFAFRMARHLTSIPGWMVAGQV